MNERTGYRSLIYSGWHRPANVARHLGVRGAAMLSMIDIDACEYCTLCGTPVALIETAFARTTPKAAPVTAKLARMAHIKAYSVSYAGDIRRVKCQHCDRIHDTGSIDSFLVQRIQPFEMTVHAMAPSRYAHFLASLRNGHSCKTTGDDDD